MNIAVCFAGHLRNFDNETIYNSIQENLLKPLKLLGKVDIFFSTWDKLNTQQCFSVYNGVSNDLVDKPIDIGQLCKLYNPVAIDIENFEQCYEFLSAKHYIGFNIDRPTQNYYGMLSLIPQAYKVYRANLLRLNHQKSLGITYDLIIRYRPDWLVNKRGDFSHLEKDTLYIPGGYVDHVRLVEDYFACGNSKNMTFYSSLYLNLKEMFTLGVPDPSAVKFLYIFLKSANIKVLNLDLELQRYQT